MERTLIIVKPDAVQRQLVGQILSRFESKGLVIVGMKLIRISRELAERHYAPHKGKPFYAGLIEYITSGPVVVARNARSIKVRDEVAVGEARLVGEAVSLTGDRATIQVYEDTAGLRPGDPVFGTGQPLSVELGPGMVGNVFDGLERPLAEIAFLLGYADQSGFTRAFTRWEGVSPGEYRRSAAPSDAASVFNV